MSHKEVELGKVDGFWSVLPTAYIKYLNVEQQSHLLLMRKGTNQLHHVKNDMIISVQLEPIACTI